MIIRQLQPKERPSGVSLEDRFCLALYLAQRNTVARYRPFLEALGLTFPQYMVLVRLWEKDRVSVADLGRELDLDSGTLTPLLKRLQGKGLVDRKRSTTDERVMLISLTQTSRDLKIEAARLAPKHALGEPFGPERIAAVLAALGGEEGAKARPVAADRAF